MTPLKKAVAGQLGIKIIGDEFISNGHWAAKRHHFKEKDLNRSSIGALIPGVKIIDMEVRVLATLTPKGKLVPFERSPLMWNVAGSDAVCFVDENGRRAWFNRRYVDAFDVVKVYGSGLDTPFLDTDNVHEYSLMLMPFQPPDDNFAAKILRSTSTAEPTDTLKRDDMPGRKKGASERAVEAALPDPEKVAKEKSPDVCESKDCRTQRFGSSRWCKTHTADVANPTGTIDDVVPGPKCAKRGCMYLVEAVTNTDNNQTSPTLCHSHASDERSASKKTTARKATPAPVADNSGEDWI